MFNHTSTCIQKIQELEKTEKNDKVTIAESDPVDDPGVVLSDVVLGVRVLRRSAGAGALCEPTFTKKSEIKLMQFTYGACG